MNRRRLLPALLLFCAQAARQAQSQRVRPAAVADAFYPADAKELVRMIDGFLAAAKPPEVKEVVALVAPHAGYLYSGGVAAHAYALLKGRKVERVVVISPSHVEAFPFSAVYDGVALANLCRENEIKRAKGGSTQREKGERPLISCSESRLYGNKALVLWRERETLMADARSRISVVLDAWQPRDAKEMQAALDVALGELTQTAREVIAARERELARAESEADEIGREGAALIREVKDEIDRELLTEAWTEGDEKQMQEVLSRQPLEWLKKWASLTERAQKYA